MRVCATSTAAATAAVAAVAAVTAATPSPENVLRDLPFTIQRKCLFQRSMPFRINKLSCQRHTYAAGEVATGSGLAVDLLDRVHPRIWTTSLLAN